MTWHQFWEEPAMSYGSVAFLLFCVWLVHQWERVHAEQREAVRRWNEAHPFGEVKTLYEREHEETSGDRS